MATLEVLRNRAGIFVAVMIGLGLLAFIFSDFFTSGRSLFAGDQMEVGRVDGVSMSYPEYMEQYEQQRALRQAFSGQMGETEQFSRQLREQVWQTFVRGEVLGRECERIGLSVTSDELSEMVIGNEVHPVVRQIFTNPQTGEFNTDDVVRFLSNLEQGVGPEQRAYWLEIEREIQEERVSQKYSTLVAKGLYVTNYEIERAKEQQANQVDVAYVFQSFASVPDSLIRVTEGQAESYYKAHRELFRGKEQRDLAYVTFEVRPSDEDVTAAQEAVVSALGDFATVTNAGQYASQNGDHPYTGAWLTKDALPEQIAEWAYSGVAVDAVSPVVREGMEFMAARLLGRRVLPDSAHARHILFSYQQYPPARAHELADSIKALLQGGADFALLAAQFSDDPGSKDQGGDLNWFRQGIMVPPFNDACFLGKKGDIQVVETNFGVHLIEVLGQSGEQDCVDVAILSREVVASNHTFQKVYNEAVSFAAQVHRERPGWLRRMFGAGKEWAAASETLFDSIVESSSLQKRLANRVEEDWPQISGLEGSREVVRWAFEAVPGQVSAVFELPSEYVVAFLIDQKHAKGDYMAFSAVRQEAADAVAREQREAYLRDRFIAAAGDNQDVGAFAAAVGESVRHAPSVVFNGYSFGQEGFEPGLVGAASALPAGLMAKPVTGLHGVYMMQAESVAPSSGETEDLRTQEQDQLRRVGEMQAYPALQDMASIVDRRAKFF